jgi:putative oxidoreductase
MATIAAVLGRILLGALFVFSGLSKVMDPAATAAYMNAESPFPGSFATGVGIFEIVAGLILASGFMTRLASAALVVFTAIATLFFHEQITEQVQAQMALKNLAIIGGLLAIYVTGPGALSVDAKS